MAHAPTRGVRRGVLGLVLSLVVVCCPRVDAQWLSRTISLQPGWNAVFLEAEPSPNTCDDVFAGIPVEAVCSWRPRQSAVQYIQNPDEVLADSDDWLVYFPPSTPASALTTLHIIEGGKPYLIKLGGGAPVDWTFLGRPVVRPPAWLADSFNLVGLPVATAGGPTFQDLFAASEAHAGQPIYRLSGAEWTLVGTPATARPTRAEAFWVYTEGPSDYAGPLRLTLPQRTGLNYSDILTELTVVLENETAATATCTISPRNSAAPPNPDEPALAGAVPLSCWDYENFQWNFLTAAVAVDVPAGEKYRLRLAVRRADMAPYTPKQGAADHLYQGFVKAAYGDGNVVLIPVTARGLGAAARKYAAKDEDPHLRAGLWLGYALVDQVSEPAGDNPDLPTPTASEFQFRLVVHVDAAGTARLLQQVVQMWRPGTYAPDPDDPSLEVVDQPGEYVLITDEALLASFEGATLRDGVPVGRRVSTAAFGFREPVEMTGVFPTPGDPITTVDCTVELDYDDPVNPFKHKYHPDHDNLGASFDEEHPLAEGKESYTVTREIELAFTADDPDGLGLAGWGDNQIGGAYRETIAGIHRDPIHAEGTFRLRRVSTVAELDPAP